MYKTALTFYLALENFSGNILGFNESEKIIYDDF